MAEVRPGAGAVNNYWAEDFTPGDGPLIDVADLTYIGTTQNITAAGAINPLARYVAITGPASSTYAVTLAAPTEPGRTMVIEMTGTTSTNAVTLALTNVVGGSAATTATFNAADETLSKSNKWVVLDELGVTLA
jgi:hypothetical protein